MKFKELKQKTAEERQKILAETKLELMKENAQVSTGTMLKSPGKVKELKKTIARLKQLENN